MGVVRLFRRMWVWHCESRTSRFVHKHHQVNNLQLCSPLCWVHGDGSWRVGVAAIEESPDVGSVEFGDGDSSGAQLFRVVPVHVDDARRPVQFPATGEVDSVPVGSDGRPNAPEKETKDNSWCFFQFIFKFLWT